MPRPPWKSPSRSRRTAARRAGGVGKSYEGSVVLLYFHETVLHWNMFMETLLVACYLNIMILQKTIENLVFLRKAQCFHTAAKLQLHQKFALAQYLLGRLFETLVRHQVSNKQNPVTHPRSYMSIDCHGRLLQTCNWWTCFNCGSDGIQWPEMTHRSDVPTNYSPPWPHHSTPTVWPNMLPANTGKGKYQWWIWTAKPPPCALDYWTFPSFAPSHMW